MAQRLTNAAIASGAKLTGLAQTGSIAEDPQNILNEFTRLASALDGLPESPEKDASETALNILRAAHERRSGALDKLVIKLNDALSKLKPVGGRRRKTRRGKKRSKRSRSGTKSSRL